MFHIFLLLSVLVIVILILMFLLSLFISLISMIFFGVSLSVLTKNQKIKNIALLFSLISSLVLILMVIPFTTLNTIISISTYRQLYIISTIIISVLNTYGIFKAYHLKNNFLKIVFLFIFIIGLVLSLLYVYLLLN